MPDGKETITVKVMPGIGAIDAAAWDACAGEENPFLSHAFLKALEDSGSCRAATGWQPQHLVLEAPNGDVVGTVPLYLKSHSYGEYVFDHAWANAYEAEPNTAYRTDNVTVFDAKIEKRFRFGGRSLSAFVDAFNILNTNAANINGAVFSLDLDDSVYRPCR